MGLLLGPLPGRGTSGLLILSGLPKVVLALFAKGRCGEVEGGLNGEGPGNRGGMAAGDIESLSSSLDCTTL